MRCCERRAGFYYRVITVPGNFVAIQYLDCFAVTTLAPKKKWVRNVSVIFKPWLQLNAKLRLFKTYILNVLLYEPAKTAKTVNNTFTTPPTWNLRNSYVIIFPQTTVLITAINHRGRVECIAVYAFASMLNGN